MYGSFQERLLVAEIARRNFAGECSFMILKVDYGEKESGIEMGQAFKLK
jgi:hypothetical protein